MKIIKIIQNNKYVTIPELSDELNISTRAIEKQISNLKKQGLVRRIGPAKGGHWEVINEK